MPVTIRCRYCGARESITESVLKSFGTGGASVVRSCSACRAGTPWDIVTGESSSGSSSSFSGARFEDEEPAAAQMRGTKRLLLIDDDTEVLTILSRALGREPIEIETASSGREALNRLVREDFDLVLCDVRMPQFDGRQLFKFLEEHLPEQKENVIFLTGDAGGPSTGKFLAESGAPYLPKPVDLERLVEIVRERLGISSEADGAEAGWGSKTTS